MPRLARPVLVSLLGALLSVAVAGPTSAQVDAGVPSDTLEVRLTNSYAMVWDDAGSDADRDVSIARPAVPSGWYSLGHVALGERNDFRRSDRPWTLLVRERPGQSGILAAPTGWRQVWDSDGSDARRVWFFQPLCPSGYVALGGMATTQEWVFDASIRCIRADHSATAAWEARSVWDDAGSDADDSSSLWRAQQPTSSPANQLVLAPGLMWPVPIHESPDRWRDNPQTARALRLTFYNAPNPIGTLSTQQLAGLARPRLTGPGQFVLQEQNLPTVTYQVPFFEVRDPGYPDAVTQWAVSPYYTITRRVRYRDSGQSQDNTCQSGSQRDTSLTYEHSTEVTDSTESFWSVGVSISASFTAEVAPLGVGGEATAGIEFNASGGHSWGTSLANGTSWQKTYAPARGQYLRIFFRESTFEVRRADGSSVPGARMTENDVEAAYWTPPGWTEADPCRTSLGFLMQAPAVLEAQRRYWPAGDQDAGYFLVWNADGDGDLQVRSNTGGVAFSLKALGYDTSRILGLQFDAGGRLLPTLSQVRMGDGVSIPPTWVGSAGSSLPSGAMLILTPDGVLQIVSRSGTVHWSSDTVAPAAVAPSEQVGPAIQRVRIVPSYEPARGP